MDLQEVSFELSNIRELLNIKSDIELVNDENYKKDSHDYTGFLNDYERTKEQQNALSYVVFERLSDVINSVDKLVKTEVSNNA